MTGAELRASRRKLGLSQEQMATKLELTRETIGRYERGVKRIPRVVEYAVRYLLALR